jgi:hypothetical protein
VQKVFFPGMPVKATVVAMQSPGQAAAVAAVHAADTANALLAHDAIAKAN